MPLLQNAKKALRVSKRKAATNRPLRSRLKTTFDAAKKGSEPSLLSSAFSAIDKAIKSHIIHRKKGAHMKSQLAKATSGTSTTAAPAKAKAAKAAPKKAAAKKTASKAKTSKK